MDGVVERSTGCRAQVEFCIDAFAEETGYVPASARDVRNPNELSPSLERRVGALETTAAWRAWEERGRAWFIEGRLIRSPDAPADAPTAHLVFRDHRARAIAAGVWCRSAPARWDLVHLVNPTRDATA